MTKTELSAAAGLGADAKMELHQRRSDSHHPFSVKRMSWSWFSVELVRIQPTETGSRRFNWASIQTHQRVRGCSRFERHWHNPSWRAWQDSAPFHFIWAFKHSVGLSPYHVLAERISVATKMLSQSDLLIADVALAAGFSGAAQLNRVFRKPVGVTPTVFRRENGLR